MLQLEKVSHVIVHEHKTILNNGTHKNRRNLLSCK
jgi:hypothetical protein